MPAIPIIAVGAAVVGAGAAVAGTVGSISAQNKANNLAKQQYAYERQLNDYNEARSRRDAIRSARLTQGSLVQTANNQGAADSSAALGGQGSIVSQLNDNLSFLDQTKTATDTISQLGVDRQSALANAGNWASIGALGMQIFSLSSGGKGKRVSGR